MARYQILYWKDIPAQIKVVEPGKRPLSRPLPERYQQQIDALAMQLGLYATDAYLEQWHWSEPEEMPGTADEVAAALLEKFERS